MIDGSENDAPSCYIATISRMLKCSIQVHLSSEDCVYKMTFSVKNMKLSLTKEHVDINMALSLILSSKN